MNTTMRILRTPLSRLARGQVGPVPKVDEWLVTADLPNDLRDLVRRVVCRARLKRHERAEVAAELAAHFADALAAGETSESAAQAFGDEELTARLIRRAVIRKRPAWWHAVRGACWVTASVVGLYVASGAYFFSGRPTLTVDYIQKINLYTGATSAQRAWPLYIEALIPLEKEFDANRARKDWSQRKYNELLTLVDAAKPGDEGFDEVKAYVRLHAESLVKARRAASMPILGFNIGPSGDAYDPQRYSNRVPSTSGDNSLVFVLQPYVSDLHRLTQLLNADARAAQAEGDADRFMANFEALLGMSRQMSGKGHPLVAAFVSMRIRDRAHRVLGEVLQSNPELLSEQHLVRAAHVMAGPRSAADLIDLTFQQYEWRDVLQRCYTHDGNGDGRLTPQGLKYLLQFLRPSDRNAMSDSRITLLASGLTPLTASRREVSEVLERHFRQYESRFTQPYRDVVNIQANAESDEIRRSPLQSVRFLPVSLIASSMDRSHWRAEQSLAQRDGLTVAIALELHRRRAGHYPATLEEIPRELLPSIPTDPFTGSPIGYRLVDGRPLVYSVGADRDDDNGRGAQLRGGDPDPRASEWANDTRPPPDGDWLLWPSPRERSLDED